MINNEKIPKYIVIWNAAFSNYKSALIVEDEVAKEEWEFSVYKNNMYAPIIMLKAFACELFVKSILEFDCIEIKKEHRLKELFKLLNRERTIKIVGDLINIYNERDGGIIEDFLYTNFDRISNAFIDWRYFFEKEDLKVNNVFLTRLTHILYNYTKQLYKIN